jgi:hypothetical protein
MFSAMHECKNICFVNPEREAKFSSQSVHVGEEGFGSGADKEIPGEQSGSQVKHCQNIRIIAASLFLLLLFL